MRLVSAGLLAALLPGLAAAETIEVRAGNHPGHGRLVFAWPAPPAYSLEQKGERVQLGFPPGNAFALPGALPRNVVSLMPEGSGVRLVLRPGARVRHYRLGGRVVVDVLDPPSEATAAAEAPAAAVVRPGTDKPRKQRLAQAVPPAPAPAPSESKPVAEAAPAAAAPPLAVLPRAVPEGEAARPRVAHPQPIKAAGPLLLRLPAGTGAAMLRRGEQTLLLFDSSEAPDLAALRGQPGLAAVTAEQLPGATLLRLPATPVRLWHEPTGWRLQATAKDTLASPAAPEVGLEVEAGPPPRLVLRAATPGRVVPILDPDTGLPLLIGTLRDGGEAVAAGRRMPEMDVLPTQLGVAVLARSDGIALQAGTDRFVLGAVGADRLALDPVVAQPPAAPAMTHGFDLPTRPVGELLQRLQALQAGIAATPPLSRSPQRRAAGETLLALGLPQEAQAMLSLGLTEDPRAAADPQYVALAAAAALLAGRVAEAGALRAPDWPDTDEARLWRAALAAEEGKWHQAGPGFAATMPLLLGYPAGLRARLLPLAALALAESGEAAALRRLLPPAGVEAEEFALPAAILAAADGRTEEALSAYDRIAIGRDRKARAAAIRRAVELRLAKGQIDPAQAAKTLETALFAWRGDARELELRLRLAALRRTAGDARGALALLRETDAMMPDQAALVQPALRDSFVAALAESPPLAAVAMFDAYPDMLAGDPRAEEAVPLLAERLMALDLGDRAAKLLRQAMLRAEGVSRATLGQRLAAARLAEGDSSGALAALSDSAATGLPEGLTQDRAVLAAQADARQGRQAEAVAALRALGPAGQAALSEVLADAADWSGAAAALEAHLAATLSSAPAVLGDTERRRLLRQAALLALAGEDTALARLREAQADRMGEGPLAEAFQLLTADPLRGLADLPRLQRELQLFRTLPSRLEALRAGASVTR